jgi:alkanesulfonate monooxygenase SsuD/methylene tetrahydromethanopterin reductase-like flavin-dependent oxidoreductase (luciferase family)
MAASVGLAFTPFEDRVEVIERAAVLAEERELESIGVAEAMTRAAPIVLARLAERTERIRLISGVLSVWGSHSRHTRSCRAAAGLRRTVRPRLGRQHRPDH